MCETALEVLHLLWTIFNSGLIHILVFSVFTAAGQCTDITLFVGCGPQVSCNAVTFFSSS